MNPFKYSLLHDNPHDMQEACELMIKTQLRPRGILDEMVLHAIRNVPRHLFVPSTLQNRAYTDEALPIAEEQTISQPFVVAAMTQALMIQPGHRILELGTGTGYQTAILAFLTGSTGVVYTIERIVSLSQAAQDRLNQLGLHNIHYHVGDGSQGWHPESSVSDALTYPSFLVDRILITASVPEIPSPLITQLAVDGIMVLPVGTRDSQMLTCIRRTSQGFVQRELFSCRFVPLLGKYAWSPIDAQ